MYKKTRRTQLSAISLLIFSSISWAGGGDPAPEPEPEPALLANPGPGLGNLSYQSNELFQTISRIDRSNGVPASYPFRKAHGLNITLMHNGYFLTLFAPDSGSGPGGFLLYDVSNPRDIQLVKTIYEPEGRTSDFREAHAVGASTINGRDYIVIQTTQGIEFWDFTDINDIQQTAKLNLPGVNGGDYTGVSWQLWWQAPYVYVAVSNQGVYVVDASNPAAPVIADRGNGQPNPIPPAELGGFRVGPIFTMGNHMVLSSMDQTDGFSSLDISDPLNPVLLATTPTLPQTYYATCFSGNKLVASVRGGSARMVTYDLTDPGKFVLENDDLLIPEQLYCATQDNYVFQGAQDYVHKVDITNPFNYVEVGNGTLNVSNPDHGQVSPFGNLVFIGNDHGTGSGFIVHDVNPDTTAPAFVEVSPRNGSTRQAITSRVGVAFSDTIDLDSVNSSSFIVQPLGGAPLAGFYSAQLGIVNFAPAQPLEPNTLYQVIIPAGGLKDYAGNGVEAQMFTFTTGSALDSALTNHWPLDSDARDIKGSLDGSVTGGIFDDGGYRFNGQSPMTLDEDVSTILGGSATLSFYLKTTQVGTPDAWDAPGIAGRDDSGVLNDDGDVFWGWLDNNGHINISAGNDVGIRTPSPINDNQWRHITLTRDSGTGQLRIYINGQLVASGAARSGFLGGESWNEVLAIGQIANGGQVINGYLDDVRIYNKVLSVDEIQELLNESVVVSLPPSLTETVEQVGNNTTFDANVKGGVNVEFSWNFGDGTVTPFSTQSASTHSYNQAGHYQVILTVRANGDLQTISFTHTVTYPLTANAPSHSSTIVGDNNQVYNVNPDNGTVTALNIASMQKQWETPVGEGPRTLAIAPDGRIWVAVQEEDALVVLNTNGSVHAKHLLPYGSGPYGVTFAPNGQQGYVTLNGKSQLAKFDTNTGEMTQTINLASDPRGVAINADSDTAYVTRFRSTASGAEIYEVDLANMTLTQTLSLQVDTTTVDGEDRARGVPNYLNQVVITPDGRRAWLPSKKDNIVRGGFRDGQALEHDKMVRSIMSQIDLNTGTEVVSAQIDFNDRAPARAVAFSPLGDYAFVAQMESNQVEIVDVYTGSVRGGMTNTGSAPQGLYLDATSQRLFVHNFLNRNVAVYDMSDTLRSVSFAPARLAAVDTVSTETLDATVLRGKQIFYNAADTRMSEDGYMSCASCHSNGDDDGMVWDFTDRGEGLRNTISLRGRMGTAHGPVHWSANFDEIQDFENDIRNGFGGTGFMSNADFAATSDTLGTPKAGRSADLDAMAAYVTSLESYPRSPARNENGALTATAEQGKAVFDSLNCGSCHSGATGTDNVRHDVGTIQLSSGNRLGGVLDGLDTPTLHGVWATAPYLHDGSASTLNDVVSGHGGTASLTTQQRDALVTYLASLDGEKQYFRMQAGHANSCWVANGESDDANIRASGCDTYDDQFWYQDILSRFHAKRNEGFCAQGRPNNNGWFTVNRCDAGDDQQWVTTGKIVRTKQDQNYVVDDYSGNTQVGMWQYNGGSNQQWTKLPVDFVNLRNGAGGCLTATGTNQNDNVAVTACRDDELQRWWLKEDGTLRLMSNPRMCLDHKGELNNNGALVVWGCSANGNQQFSLQGDTLRAVSNTQFVVDKNGSTDNATLWQANGGTNQSWSLEKH